MFKAIGKWSIASGIPLPSRAISKFAEWQVLRETLVLYKINCVLDVGANSGQFATNLRRIGYRGHIVSFEPVPAAFAMAAARFKRDPCWRGHNVALGKEKGQLPFHIALDSTAMSSLHTPIDRGWNIRTIDVFVNTLDNLMNDILEFASESPRMFLKMDTQGYDLQVVQGAAQSIGSILGLQSELSVIPTYQGMPSYLEALTCYEHLGFQLVGISPAMTDPQGRIGELNCVMVREVPAGDI